MPRHEPEPLAGPMPREEFEQLKQDTEEPSLEVPTETDENAPRAKPTLKDATARLVRVINVANEALYDPDADRELYRDTLWGIAEMTRQALDILVQPPDEPSAP